MLTNYRTLLQYGEETIIIKKSRFIGQAMPVETEQDALNFIESIQKKHWDANHNCYAYQLGPNDEIQKSNDNGEPAGTAGKPILEVIKKEELKNVVVVVTRYFGGVLLGTGGLIRAYGQTAAAGLHSAEIITRSLFQAVRVQIDYTWLGKVENETLGSGSFIDHTEYTDKVAVVVLVAVAQVGAYTALITNLTNGQATLTLENTLFASLANGKLIK